MGRRRSKKWWAPMFASGKSPRRTPLMEFARGAGEGASDVGWGLLRTALWIRRIWR
jgi:hypothetical protein